MMPKRYSLGPNIANALDKDKIVVDASYVTV